LPAGYTLDSLITLEQFAVWRQVAECTVRSRVPTMPGVIAESRLDIRVHPRTYLEAKLRRWRPAGKALA
jgi:hypothetical protein